MPRLLLLAFALPLALLLSALPATAQGYADVVFANDFNGTGGFNRVCRNGGTGAFACDFVTTNTDRRRGRGVTAADLDGDGDDDLAFANYGGSGLSGAANRVCLNNAGAFACADVEPAGAASAAVAAGDPGADGDRDLVFATVGPSDNGALNRFCRNAGNGTFTCSDVSPDLDETFGVAIADLDGDGDRDLVFANDGPGTGGDTNRMCLNNGTGTFTCADVAPGTAKGDAVDTGDLDGDGDVDLVFANFFGPDRVCLNGGAATFTCANLSSDGGDTFDVEIADFDGDGDRDLVLGTAISNDQNRTNKICLNNGAAVFTCASLSADTDHSRDVEAADFDGDGDLDVAVANEDFFTLGNDSGIDQICLNNGSAVFTCADISTTNDDSIALAVGNFGGSPVAVEAPPVGTGGLSLAVAPNPVRGAATLALALGTAGGVRAEVYSVLGHRVAVLHDGPLAAGAHTLALDLAGLPAGVYVMRATSGAAVATQRVTVVR